MSRTDCCLAFDIGGTTLRAALYSVQQRTIVRSRRLDTPADVARDGGPIHRLLLDAMRATCDDLSEGANVRAIAVAFPGPIDGEGRALCAPTVWRGGRRANERFPVLEACRQLWPGTPVVVLNDVTAAGFYYVHRGYLDFCIVTVSSGIGNKIFLAGHPLLGPGMRGGEIGHLRVDRRADAPVCDCGERGHLGAIASGRGVLRLARALARSDPAGFSRSTLASHGGDAWRAIDNRRIAQAFLARDPWTVSLVREASAPLATQLAAMHTGLGLERFILMGGFALALGEPYRALVSQLAHESCWDLGQSWEAMITLGEDDSIGMVGAAEFALAASGPRQPRTGNGIAGTPATDAAPEWLAGGT